jgi:hypothetical protein
MIELKVWEIVAQSEPHTDVDPVDVGALIRFVICHFCSFIRIFFSLSQLYSFFECEF